MATGPASVVGLTLRDTRAGVPLGHASRGDPGVVKQIKNTTAGFPFVTGRRFYSMVNFNEYRKELLPELTLSVMSRSALDTLCYSMDVVVTVDLRTIDTYLKRESLTHYAAHFFA
jgi:hypothetical protein